ncbi:MAG TPA: hypothetical protein VIW07_13375 [Candidatus Udaeobacter sp.]|jgi:hypothetical protein
MIRFVVSTLRSGIPFGIAMAITIWFIVGSRLALSGGVVAGLLFGILMAAFVTFQRRRFLAQQPDFPDEEVVWQGPANHFFNGEGVGGWLYLTTRRLFFRSHAVNIQRHETNLLLADIAEATPRLTAGFIPNGLLVRTASGAEERFVVDGRKRWCSEITNAKKRNA